MLMKESLGQMAGQERRRWSCGLDNSSLGHVFNCRHPRYCAHYKNLNIYGLLYLEINHAGCVGGRLTSPIT